MWAYNNLDGNCGLTLVKVQGNHNRELLRVTLSAYPVPTQSNSCSLPTLFPAWEETSVNQ